MPIKRNSTTINGIDKKNSFFLENIRELTEEDEVKYFQLEEEQNYEECEYFSKVYSDRSSN